MGDKRLENGGYTVIWNPPGNGDCFYEAAAFQPGVDVGSLKNLIFAHLENYQFDEVHWNCSMKYLVKKEKE